MAQQYVEIVTQAYAVARGGSTKPIYNVWHFRRTAAVLAVSKAQIEAAFQASVGAALLAFLSVDYTQTNTTVRFFDDALDAPIAFPETGVGAIAGERLETFVAAVFSYKSAVKGKFARGNKHLAPIAEADSNGDVLTSASQTRLQAVADAYKNGFTDAGGNVWIPIVKSNKAPAQYKTNPVVVVTYDVIGVSINKTTGTMKRRKVKTVV